MLEKIVRLLVMSVLVLGLIVPAPLVAWPVEAAVSGWQKGVNVVPTSTTDFASESFKQSLRNLRGLGATHVALVVPLYQSNIYSTDIQSGWNTPTDQALASAIDFAHSLGFKVMLKVHSESYGREWRAHINPGDREGWFRNYGDRLVALARLADEHGVELISIGAEMVSLAASNRHSTNTANWSKLIDRVREVYSGQLTYSANSTNNNDDPFQNEKKFIGFWHKLDYAGLSVYYNLNTPSNSVDALKGAWDYWNNNDIRAFQQGLGKPVLFTEIGYRSVSGAHFEPWNWERGGSPDMTEQANAYEALLSYWNSYDYVQGVYFWDWEVNPNAGGTGSTSYTPQNKPAQNILKNWFASAPPPQPPTERPVFTSSAQFSSSNPAIGQAVTITATVRNTSGTLGNGLVDVEIYNEANQRVEQKFYGSQSFSSGQSRSYTLSWTPRSAGRYTVKIGVFGGSWSPNYHWNNQAAVLATSGTTGGDNNTTPSGDRTVSAWWPADGATVNGTQPFKAVVNNMALKDYRMFWQVDGDRLNPMYDSNEDGAHKEAYVDVSGWRWRGSGPYTITFVAQNLSGQTIGSKSVKITVR